MCWQRIGFVGGVLDKWLRGYLHGKTWSGLDSIPTVPLTVFSEGCRTKKVYGLQSDEEERERKREKSNAPCFLRPPSFSPRVLRDSGRIVGGKFTRVRSERKAVSIFRDKLVTVYRNWKLNRGTYGFFSSLVLFFVTFKEDLLPMFASKLWTFSWNFLGKRFKRDFSFFLRAKTNFWNQFDSY